MTRPVPERLPLKEIIAPGLGFQPWDLRILQLDPSPLYRNIRIDPYARRQVIGMERLFPKQGKLCACGCRNLLIGRQTRWSRADCSNFVGQVHSIITGDTAVIGRYLHFYYGWTCQRCGCEDKGHDCGALGTISWIKVDHIIPVKHGGGGCWLNNYQLLCHDCHVIKTKEDFGWGQGKSGKNSGFSLFPE